jgi:hypothetical protein
MLNRFILGASFLLLSFTAVNAQSLTISGRVSEPPSVTGVGIAGVTMTLTLNGSTQTITQTDTSGAYSFSNVPAGSNYQVVPTKASWSFNPISQSGTDIGFNQTLYFTGSSTGAGSTIQFTTTTTSASESVGDVNITVSRSGDASGAASVNYATSDTAAANPCSAINSVASSRCDYLTTLGTLSFAAGETSKVISIPVIDDAYAEGNESFKLTLSNSVGATLGATSQVTITLNDNETVNGANPVDQAAFFVRQHYIDFLNREPDASGLNFWTQEITSCGSNTQCIEVKRINVSAAFFLSTEFQETGYLAYRIYKVAFGNISGAPVPVTFLNFLRDQQQIGKGIQVGVGNWQAQLEANKQAFALAFVQRAEFLAAYPNSMTATEIVTKLNTNAGGALSASEQSDLINTLGASPSDIGKRAQVLRAVADDQTFRTAENNRAFVLMQYFGYMRRSPNDAPDIDFSGYNFWLTKLNSFNGDFVAAEMVKAFITSAEYRQRFGP